MTAASLNQSQRQDLGVGLEGQHLPLHRLWRDRGRHPWRAHHRTCRGRQRLRPQRWRRRRPAPSLRAPRGIRSMSRQPGCFISSCCARRTRMPASNRSAKMPHSSVPGVHAVLTWEDAPAKLYSTARHEDESGDPDDTAVLDNVVRFIGQRVAAVIARQRGDGRSGLPQARRRLRDSAGSFRSRTKRCARARRSSTTKTRRRASTIRSAISSPKFTAMSAMSRTALPQADVVYEGDLHDPARTARASGNALRHRLAG